MHTYVWSSFAASLLVLMGAQGEDAALKKELAALQGSWKVLSLETPKGKDDNFTGAVLEIDKDGKSLTFTKDGQAKKGTFKLNPAGKPKEIDVMPGDENKTMEGIYELDKTMLKICITEDSNDGRPNEFAVKEGKRFVLISLERQK